MLLDHVHLAVQKTVLTLICAIDHFHLLVISTAGTLPLRYVVHLVLVLALVLARIVNIVPTLVIGLLATHILADDPTPIIIAVTLMINLILVPSLGASLNLSLVIAIQLHIGLVETLVLLDSTRQCRIAENLGIIIMYFHSFQ